MNDSRRPTKLHMAGDEVFIPPFSFHHEMNVSGVEAVFVHEDGNYEITLTGVPKRAGLPQEVRTVAGPRLFKYGAVRLRAIVAEGAPAGRYMCKELAAQTAGGKRVLFATKPSLSFAVALEPSKPPHIFGEISLGQQTDMFHIGGYDEEKDEITRPVFDREKGRFVNPEQPEG